MGAGRRLSPPPIELEVLDGHHAGRRATSDGGPLYLGRADDVQLRLDPDTDLEVSGKHAVVEPAAEGWQIRDLGSRNGTWVGNERITDAHRLADGQVVRLGPGGPRVVVRIEAERRTVVFERLTRQNTALWRGLVALAALLLVGGLVGGWAWTREQSALRERMDSVLVESRGTITALQGEVGGLADALEASRARVESLRVAVSGHEIGPATGDELARLRARLDEATAALGRQQLAASLDFEEIERLNRSALALLFVEAADGEVSTATAFAVTPDGTLVTNRHVVLDGEGRPPQRVGVQFAGLSQVWRGRVLRVAEDADLALVKVDDIEGGNPVVLRTGPDDPPLAGGAPVAVLGFPLASTSRSPTPLVTAGVVSDLNPREIRVRGWGAEGASGSPIFDARGRLVGVLYGGTGDGPEQTLFGVPASAVELLLAAR